MIDQDQDQDRLKEYTDLLASRISYLDRRHSNLYDHVQALSANQGKTAEEVAVLRAQYDVLVGWLKDLSGEMDRGRVIADPDREPKEEGLLPCPFCGGDNLSPIADSSGEWAHVYCLDCGAGGPSVYVGKAKPVASVVIRAWNRLGRRNG